MRHTMHGLAGALLLALGACGQGQAPEAASTAAAPNWPPPRVERHLDPDQVARGKAVYRRHCQSCHGPAGQGLGGDWRVRAADGTYPPPPLDDSAHAWHHPTRILHQVIKFGSPGGRMPAWKDVLTDAGIGDVVVYIKSLWSDEVYAVWHDIERRALEP